jgi:hypothetical protein
MIREEKLRNSDSNPSRTHLRLFIFSIHLPRVKITPTIALFYHTRDGSLTGTQNTETCLYSGSGLTVSAEVLLS